MARRPLLSLVLLGLTLPLSLAPLALEHQSASAQTNPTPSSPTPAAIPKAEEPDIRSYMGAWALTDSQNNLFNVRINPGGRAVSTIGTLGMPPAGARRLTDSQLRQLGRWQPWGNGIRINYSDGWSDWIYVGPSGLSHASWEPGQGRGSRPSNFGQAVKLGGSLAAVVGVYRFSPAQADLKPYIATLLSNGQAFNDIDAKAGGVWRLDGNTVVINWISGWRTTMSLDPVSRLQLRHWAPGTDRNGPPTGGVRKAVPID